MYKDVGKVKKNKITDLYDVMTDTEIPAIKNSIKNILLTPKGSLQGNPNFGSDLYKIMFEPMDALTTLVLSNFVEESLGEFEPRVRVIDTSVNEVPEYNRIIINISFQYIDKRTGDILTDTVDVTVNRD